MLLPLRLTVIWLCLLGAPALAQFTPAAPAETETATEPATDSTTAPASTEALIELLRDDAARAALIRQLEQAAAGESATAADAGAAAADGPAPLTRSLGREISELTQAGLARVTDTLAQLSSQLSNLPQTLGRLGEAADPQVLADALRDLAFVIAVTVAAFVALRWILGRPAAALARRAQGAGWFETAAYQIGYSLLHAAAVVLAWAAGYALTISFYDGFGSIQVRQSLYLNAFVGVGLAKVAGRAILSPKHGSLRLISLSDPAAQSIWRWLNTEIVLLGYGIMLAVPIVARSAGFFAGAALEMALGAIAILYTVVRVVRARRPVANWLYGGTRTDDAAVDTEAAAPDTPAENSRRPVLARFAALWHWPVLGYLLVLLVLVLARPGGVLVPLLKSSALVLATVIGGMMAIDLMTRSARRGVRLAPSIQHRLPLLEKRLNGLLPKILLVLRIAVALVVVAISLDVVGLWDISGWLKDDVGLAFTSTTVSVLLILLFAALVWLALASWVEYRLNPLVGKVPTARETTLLTLLRNASAIALLILTLMFTLSQIGLDIAPLLASAGVLGLAIGFGAQKMVQDIITGIFIQFENAMNVGDVVGVAGIVGVVEKLTVRSVSLRDVQGVFHIIPFSSVDSVSNHMKEFSYHVADMGIAYREDTAQAKQAMFDAFDLLLQDEEHRPNILGEMEWFGLNSFGDSAVVLRSRIKTLPGKQWAIGRAYNQLLKEIFDERGIEIPFPHQTIYFGEDRQGNAPPLHIRADAPLPLADTRSDGSADG
ncbi:mechanosensitive ion channel [Rhodobacteraceae bacterium 2CG4]|uniref:Mechanosensitive ion channel n=1 Tax=Halovulum marinum TaxID=2662447 RepID=A0A6L5Z2F2_9RHOB|nr:mechanosensitive ion channel domain-containing protein [Halovulum marinum]MSU90449.1 mechanosensitive ion channel [Halovulum marinum]